MAAIQRAITQRRKPPQDIERENFEKHQAIHVQKAINNLEGATKEKHLRAIILGTFKYQGGLTFWTHASKLSVQGHPIVCWKFCHVVYKLLREGHINCIRHSQKYHTLFVELGKLWCPMKGHLKDGYGASISAFTKVIVQKLNFHKKNVAIPGNLAITKEVLIEMTQNDINSYFEISVDMLDYMDEILNFEETVFGSLDRSRSNSMTAHGQCKLTPIILVLQDSAALYDNLVKVLFKLHAILPSDTLSGHRSRFLKQYRALQVFYKNCQNLQYFKNLIQVPTLPENPPNFLIESELASFRAPVVTVVPEPEPAAEDEAEAEDSVSFALADVNDVPPALPPRPSAERDKFEAAFGSADLADFSFNGSESRQQQDRVDDLLLEIDRLQRELERLKSEHKERVTALMNRIKTLEEEVKKLVQLKTQLEEEQAERAEATSQQDERYNAIEEKFRKMKDLYSKIREEHVGLLRSNAKVKMDLAATQKAFEEKSAELSELQNEAAHLKHQKQVAAEVQRSADDASSQLTAAKTTLLDYERTNQELSNQRADLQKAKAGLEDQVAALNAKQSELEQERIHAQESIQSLEARLQSTALELKNAESRGANAESQLRDLQAAKQQLEQLRQRLLRTACERGCEAISEAVAFLDAPEMLSCRGSAEFLLTRIEKVLKSISTLSDVCSQFLEDSEALDLVVCTINDFSAQLCETVLQGKATANSASSLEQADELLSGCKLSAEEGITFLEHLADGRWDAVTVVGLASSLLSQLNSVRALAEQLRPKMADVRPEEIGDLIDQEMQATSEAIRLAEEKFHNLLEKSRADMTGVQLEVHERILDSCTQLMSAIKVLVEKSKVLQREIVAEGRGTSTAKEFYKQHHRWTEGLISAAKTVGWGATALVEAADRVLAGGPGAKFEELTVCSQEIAASTAQLVVASRVKANPRSFSLSQLTEASRAVSRATGNVVACAKAASERYEEQDTMDFSKLSLTQSKRLEMNSQVKVLELEAALSKERQRLGELRKRHYQNEEDLELTADPESAQRNAAGE